MQAMRNMKDSIIEEPLIHLSILIRNDDAMNEEDDEAERWKKKSTHETNKYKYSIVIFMIFFGYAYSVDVLCMIDCLH